MNSQNGMNIFQVVAGLLLLMGVAEAQELRAYPDPTPGATDPRLTPEFICAHSTSERRSVSDAQKRKIFEAYGVPFEDRASYEVDHFIPLSIGGINTCVRPDGSEDVTCNLWPQPHQKSFPEIAPWGSETKDRLEFRLYKMMCAGEISLHDAQIAITADWEQGYRQYVAGPPAVASTAAPFTMAPTAFTVAAPMFSEVVVPEPAAARSRVAGKHRHIRARHAVNSRGRHGSRRRRHKADFSGALAFPVTGQVGFATTPDNVAKPRFSFHELWIAPPGQARDGRR